ncbi:hypothetical protein Patl1_33012 [Pistacia atlantica]|uniref:Uncharacterized protein n=1 Tax=Pistacia atlantica TaxID=434234 RepID=A0ACC1AM91_9ROSI|nr:hypothetical protein Patl1_33012 [Pistacia atlantica]
MGSLQAHESRINRSLEKNEEKAFQVKEAATKTGKLKVQSVGVVEVEDSMVMAVAKEKVEVNLTSNKGRPVSKEATGVTGCSNHMIGIKSMLKELDETRKMQVKLGNGKEIQVEGKGTVAIKTSHGKVKLLHNVQFVHDLGYNLLSCWATNGWWIFSLIR